MKRNIWTIEENSILIENWTYTNKEKLCSLLPNRTYTAIVIQANKLGLSGRNPLRNENIDKLLEETPEAYYWMGFIMADGHINTKDNRLSLRISIKDIDHLIKFSLFIQSKTTLYKQSVGTSIKHNLKMPELIKKFDINNRKTYNPPKLIFNNNDLFLSFLIGFIDGDGCIRKQTGRKDCSLTVKNYYTWENNLKEWFNKLHEISKTKSYNNIVKNKVTTHLSKCGRYSYVCIANNETLFFLKNKIK